MKSQIIAKSDYNSSQENDENSIHPTFVDIHTNHKCEPRYGAGGKVIKITHLGTMNVCTEFHPIAVELFLSGDSLTDFAILRSVTLGHANHANLTC